MKISLDELQQAPWYFRDTLGDDLKELGTSIAERQEEPILLAKQSDGSYMVIDGWRRITAAKKAGIRELEYRLYKGDDPLLSALVMARYDKSHDNFQMGGGLTDWLQKRLDAYALEIAVSGHGNSKISKRVPTLANFVTSYRRHGSHKELNEALGDPLGILRKNYGAIETIEEHIRAYVTSSEQVKKRVREGSLAATTARELSRRLSTRPDLQDNVADKCATEGLGKREAIKGSKILRAAKGDKDLEETILDLDWSRPEKEIREVAGVMRAIRGRSSNADGFKELPAVIELLDKIADFADWIYTGAKMVEIGKVSPEGRRFIANKLDSLIERLTKFKEELLCERENGAQKQKNE